LKQYFIRYKPFLFFLAKFFLTYIVLTLIYHEYLSSSVEEGRTDAITRTVAQNTVQVLELFGQEAAVEESASDAYIKLLYHQKYVARMIEGCNAISVIVLFISFVVSFSGKLKHTLLFVFGGVFIIYVLNVMRIAALCVSLYFFPEHEAVLHGVLFPLFIYGVVFVLWVIWVNKFSLYAKNTVRT
jgi:exosortase family protein XrtF